MRLYLQEDPIRLQSGQSPSIRLPLSLAMLLNEGLQRFPPSESAMEQAIAITEDALMPWIPALRNPPLQVLECADAELAALPALLGLAPLPALELAIDELEQAFNQVARVAAGVPAKSVHLPEQPRFVAALVVVRELMHHVGWQKLRLSGMAVD